MGHELKDTLHDYWSRLMAAHSVLQRDHDMSDFYTFCILQKMQYMGLCVLTTVRH